MPLNYILHATTSKMHTVSTDRALRLPMEGRDAVCSFARPNSQMLKCEISYYGVGWQI
jgi:hypothetical protein